MRLIPEDAIESGAVLIKRADGQNGDHADVIVLNSG
jgi:hypothetical protein